MILLKGKDMKCGRCRKFYKYYVEHKDGYMKRLCVNMKNSIMKTNMYEKEK